MYFHSLACDITQAHKKTHTTFRVHSHLLRWPTLCLRSVFLSDFFYFLPITLSLTEFFLRWDIKNLSLVKSWDEVCDHSWKTVGSSHNQDFACLSPGMCVCVLVVQSCLTLCNLMDCSPPGSSAMRILQARTLEWVPIPFFRGSSQPRGWTQVFHIASRFFIIWATREAHSEVNGFTWVWISSLNRNKGGF